MHLLDAADVPRVVECAGVAEVEAVLLVGERGDVWTSDGAENNECERGVQGGANWPAALQPELKDNITPIESSATTNAKDFVRYARPKKRPISGA